ncbi:ABC transporter ATP-binding protein [Nocardioides deserti]|uniref:ATP-binding cassette domain-containing protein n=1 Tax=Nocardioides deserti TaxID=1588644 RepID=A0ABR6UCC2_9ACTN|nr:oligopeptide/dipeptide ABC transporter ATP-binding protein [Nocardioides deserti]MBC2961978.1 ATP-binding cassette domain-containing protein [Nocardioides deserti]GGO70656.1 ABC transporter ATP-binding protein [Nocardioides deserti]
MADTLLEVRDLSVHFKAKAGARGGRGVVKAVDGLDFTIGYGETLGVVGESGCGKSTTGLAIQGLVKATSGSIMLEGQDLTTLKANQVRAARRRTQMVFQDPTSSLNMRMTVGQIVAEPLLVHDTVPRSEHRARAAELLGLVGMPESALDRYPHEFSGGQRQRVGIARALAVEPDLIICDEPTAALDVSIRAQVLNLFRELQRARDLSYLFISHDLSAVHHISDRILVMYLGRPMELASRDTVYNDPQHPYTVALMSAVPVPDPDIERNREHILLQGDVPSPLNPPSGCVFRTRCPLAQDVCAAEVPAWRDIGTDGEEHMVACHFAQPGMAELVAGQAAR